MPTRTAQSRKPIPQEDSHLNPGAANESPRATYGLFTTIAMIIGIVVGSGIFFRADDILSYTNGNLLLGLLALTLGSLCIILGSLTLSPLAQNCAESGGLIAYFRQFVSPEIAAGFGWFQVFMYFPAITVVIAWVAGIYTTILFQLEGGLELQMGLGIAYTVVFLLLNFIHRKLGGHFQALSTITKYIPLLMIAICGLFYTNPVGNPLTQSLPTFLPELAKGSWLTALVPLAYSYDGWVLALSIAPEVKNAKRNLPRALIMSPLIILLTYLTFFYGLTNLLGPGTVIEQQDRAVFWAAQQLVGERLGNLVLVIILISVLGVLNGIILSGIRMPQALAEKGFIRAPKIAAIQPRYQLSIGSTKAYAALLILWNLIHYLVIRFDFLKGRDISEIAIVFSYLTYIILYIVVFKQALNGRLKHKRTYQIISLFAIFGSLLLFVGSVLASPLYVCLFILFSACLFGCGYLYYKTAGRTNLNC